MLISRGFLGNFVSIVFSFCGFFSSCFSFDFFRDMEIVIYVCTVYFLGESKFYRDGVCFFVVEFS